MYSSLANYFTSSMSTWGMLKQSTKGKCGKCCGCCQ